MTSRRPRLAQFRSRPLAWLVVVGAGQSCDPQSVDPGLSLLVPEDVEVAWDAGLDVAGDGRVAVVPLDVMVYDAARGDPVPGVEVRLTADRAVLAVDGSFSALSGQDSGDPSRLWDLWVGRWVSPSGIPTRQLQVRSDESGLVHFTVQADTLREPITVSVDVTEPQRVARGEFRVATQR